MKKMFLSLVATMIATVSFAQTNVVATLTHGDEITMFYGGFALREAHAAATNGDIINLSGGAFQSVKITKALSIRGTGVNDSNPTFITGDFDVEIPSDVTERLSFEGCRIPNNITIKGSLTNAYFMKNDIQHIDIYNSETKMIHGLFANCNVYGFALWGKSDVQFINSHVEDFDNYEENKATASFINCVIRPYDGDYAQCIRSSLLTSCILYWTGYNSYSLPSTSSAINCVAVGNGSYAAFRDVVSKQNCQYADMDIFQDSNVWNDLTNEAKAKYIGNDGTPVGMYGGILPFNLIPTYPQITKMNVANKTTADGKLSVEIEVSAAQ